MSTTPEAPSARRATRSPRRGDKAKPPSTAKRRRPAMIGLALLLVVGGAAIAGLLAVRMDSRTEVLVASRDIAVGATISEGDLATARVASEGLDLIPANQASQVIGRFADVAIPQGRLVDARMVVTNGFLTEGQAAVGVPLVPGQVPSVGLIPGDVVQVIGVGLPAEDAVLVQRAVVSSVGSGASTSSGSIVGGGSSAGSSSGNATLIVSEADAVTLAVAVADQGVSLILLTPAGSVGGN